VQDPAFDPLQMLFDLQLLAHELAQANLRQAAQLNQQQEQLTQITAMVHTLAQAHEALHHLVKQAQKTPL